MDLIRKAFDFSYNVFNPILFYVTKRDPEIAHGLLVLGSKILSAGNLERLVLDNKSNHNQLPFEIVNAAGLNKNSEINPQFLKYLGFDRVVIGTVTGKSWLGSKRPRCIRLTGNESMLNWVGWDNEGSNVVAKRLKSYRNSEIPLTISVGPAPDPELSVEERIKDLEKTIKAFRDISFVDRFEYNPSCPNLCISRKESQRLLGEFISFIRDNLLPHQDLYVKVSPDLSEDEICETIKVTYDSVRGFVTTNTTTRHDYGKGGGSGNILYSYSLDMQKKFYGKLKYTDKEIIACGGIDSIERVKERRMYGAKEIQLFAPLIFKGPKLLREIRAFQNYE